ncbi:MAG TPA: hypothetical protein VGS19_11155 [Streptosporangiaceae bacterium]|nr:hypothetical protein [Streptosporangiaceae bacterium]
MHALHELARERHREMLAEAGQQRQVSQVQALRKAVLRTERAHRRLVAAEVSLLEARTGLVMDREWAVCSADSRLFQLTAGQR